MASTGGTTRQELAEISARIDNHQVQVASELIEALIKSLDRDSLMLVSPDLKQLISRLLNKRRKHLSGVLEGALARPQVQVYSSRGGAGGEIRAKPIPEKNKGQIYRSMLAELANHHIFQWATFYRETTGFIFKDLLESLADAETWDEQLEAVSREFARHAEEIFGRGHQRLAYSGLSQDISEAKSINGLLRFLYLIINLYLDARESTTGSKEARLLRDTASALIIGVLRGYGGVDFSGVPGWEYLSKNVRAWVPSLGFVTGGAALSLASEFPEAVSIAGVRRSVIPALVAIEQLGNKYQGASFVLPRLSRITVGDPVQLEITLTPSSARVTRDIILFCFFDGVIADKRVLEDALSLRATVVVATLSGAVRAWANGKDDKRVVDTADAGEAEDYVHNIAQIIRGQIEAQEAQDDVGEGSALIQRNYAREFPLEDPEFRRLFMVERHSVKQLLEQLDQGVGVHLWCSVRRSGKTTAVNNLADMTGRSTVVVQTLDHQPNQLELNIFERRVREALDERRAISHDFFQSVVNECVLSLASIQAERRKIVFVVDEYETLFGLLDAFTRNDADLRYLVVQPLLSQMVAFSARNLLILMGQRPDAHFILPSQNQLSPLVRQHNFPLFEHYSGATNTEYAQFLRRVLTEKLPFVASFVDATYAETSGHPYLTVNLMVDLCDWLIANRSVEVEIVLDAALFSAFVQERLSSVALQRSPFYNFFQKMLADYLGERSRKQEAWLHAVAMVLRQIGKAHPKVFSCSLLNYQRIAEEVGSSVRITPDQLLATATMSNFLAMDGGHVRPAIRLMGRLAASVIPQVD